MNMMRWNTTDRYEAGWFVGGTLEDGSHTRDANQWPHSIYKRANQPGVTDAVLCHGIQDLKDANGLCQLLNQFGGG